LKTTFETAKGMEFPPGSGPARQGASSQGSYCCKSSLRYKHRALANLEYDLFWQKQSIDLVKEVLSIQQVWRRSLAEYRSKEKDDMLDNSSECSCADKAAEKCLKVWQQKGEESLINRPKPTEWHRSKHRALFDCHKDV